MSDHAHPLLRRLEAHCAPLSVDPLPSPYVVRPGPTPPSDTLSDLFARRMAELRGEVHHAQDVDDAVPILARIIQHHGLTRVVCSDVPWLTSLVHRATADPLAHDVRHADGCVTPAHLLIADTGTVVVASGPMAHRGATALPRVHIVVAHQKQVVESVDDALRKILDIAGKDGLPSDIVFITGPSRTADIEKTLVIPAHGPAALHVVLIAGS